MQKLTHEAVQTLLQVAEAPGTPKVTLYVPLEISASPSHMTENQIRLKNLINKAIAELKKLGDTSKLGQELSTFLHNQNGSIEFLKDRSRGMLLCAAPGFLQTYDLPVDTEEYAAIDESFYLAPVLALLGDEREYYVLALAQQDPKLYKGSMYGLTEVDIALPASIRQGLGIDEPNQKTENQGSATGSSMSTGWFNGRGGARDPKDIDRLRFFHLIDTLLVNKLDRSLPLLLAGIDAETAEYREMSKYPKILHETIAGNQTDIPLPELFEKSHTIITEELIRPEHMAAKAEYERLQGANPERVAGDKKSIMAAAEQGRVDKLLATMGNVTTDTVQDKVEAVFRITFPEPTSSKTLNSLAMTVWKMSGKVLGLMPSEMPNGALMVARLRY